MDWILGWLKNNVSKVVAVPVVFNTLEFAMLFVDSMRDGIMDDRELHALMQAGDSISLIYLAIAMAILKAKGK